MFRNILHSLNHLADWVWQSGIDWLNATPDDQDFSGLCNFAFLEREIRPGDVVLFAGQSRVSKVIQTVVLSPWTHAALYIGRINDISNPRTRSRLAAWYDGDLGEPLVIESLLGQGTVVNPLRKYRREHLRICRPAGLTWQDADQVVNSAIEHLGMGYDVRQLLDLARFLFPYAILPRRWRSSLFQHNAGEPTHIVCSSMIARCFQQVHYPILPLVSQSQDQQRHFHERPFRLYTPSDFDYSPYFTVIKYPAWNAGHEPAYRTLPWYNATTGYVQKLPEEPEPLPVARPDPPALPDTPVPPLLPAATLTTTGLRTLLRQTSGLISQARAYRPW